MIKTDEQKVYNDSDLFLSQLNLKLNDKFIEFVHSANKESYGDMFSAFRYKRDVGLNVYLDEKDCLSISPSFLKENSKCRQFHYIQLNRNTKYYECFENLCNGKDITEKDLGWLIKKIKDKILHQHSEISNAILYVSCALDNNHNYHNLLYGSLKLYKPFDLLFSTRSISDDFIYNLPNEIFEHYICQDSVINNGLPILDIYPKTLMKIVESLDYDNGSGIQDIRYKIIPICYKITAFSELDILFFLHNIIENIESGYYNIISKNEVNVLYNMYYNYWGEDELNSQDPRIEIYKSDILSYLAED